MSNKEITNKLGQLAATWSEAQQISDRQIAEIKAQGSADPLTKEYLSKLESKMDELQSNIELASARPTASFASAPQSKEHKNAFCSYVRKGHENGLCDIERKSLSSVSDNEGGYLITRGMTDHIVSTISESSPMRGLATVTTISGDALEVIEDFDQAYSGWTLETESRSETAAPQVGKKVIPVHEIYAQPKATQKLLDDASIDVEQWLSGKLVDSFTRMENAAFINGDGVGKPQGILSYENGVASNKIEQIVSAKAGNIDAESLMQLFFSLKENFAVKGKFLMNRSAVQAIRMLKDTTSGRYLWQPGLQESSSDTLLGCEIVQAADMPGVASGNLAVAFGDFGSAYQIVDRQGIRILRDPFTDKPFVKFYATKRVGGAVVNGNAIKLLKIA